jgi:hypothetical protein
VKANKGVETMDADSKTPATQIESKEAEASQNAPYAGGNELFFSFLGALLHAVDREDLTQATVASIIREWGQSLGKRLDLPQEVGPALDLVSQTLSIMGLVRVFEPADSDANSIRAMTLRCLAGRYVGSARTRLGQPYHWPVGPLLEGMLAAGGIDVQVSFDKSGMLRNDECILSLTAKETT